MITRTVVPSGCRGQQVREAVLKTLHQLFAILIELFRAIVAAAPGVNSIWASVGCERLCFVFRSLPASGQQVREAVQKTLDKLVALLIEPLRTIVAAAPRWGGGYYGQVLGVSVCVCLVVSWRWCCLLYTSPSPRD